MEQIIVIEDTNVETLDEQQILEIPQVDLDRISGGVVTLYL